MTISELLLEYFKLENVDTIFGIPGSALENVLMQLHRQRDQIKLVIPKHESSAGYMAEGYNRSSGKLGIASATSGPGSTNLLTGVMNAHANGASVLALTGEGEMDFYGKGYLQEGIGTELDIINVFKNSINRSTLTLTPVHFKTAIEQALRDCMGTPGKGSHINLPRDIAKMELPEHISAPTTPENYRSINIGSSNPKDAQEVAEKLNDSKRPLFFIGNGARKALKGERLKRFIEFTEKHQIAVMTTTDGKALFPETHANSLHSYGLSTCGYTKEYMTSLEGSFDCLVVLGTKMKDFSTLRWNKMLVPQHGPFIQVDINPEIIGRAFPVDRAIVAELGCFIDQLCEAGDQLTMNETLVSERKEAIAKVKAIDPYMDSEKMDLREQKPMPPQALMGSLNRVIPEGSHVYVDGGNSLRWTLHYMEVAPPTQMHYSLTQAPMGFAMCAVIGSKLGDRSKHSISILGDGAFLMHGTEISTAAQAQSGAIWIVLDDNNLNMVSQGMKVFYPNDGFELETYGMGSVNLKTFCESQGADAYDVENIVEFEDAFAAAMEKSDKYSRPQVILCKIDQDEYPPGVQEYKNMSAGSK
ncbi:MAG: thiamine pyrophosphate-binding protein [Cytophagales bacterium]|nr:thiamine pyrophosphate-binding protein [Cytophagales bacterium]